MIIRRRGSRLTFPQLLISVVCGFVSGIYVFQPLMKKVSKEERNSWTRDLNVTLTPEQTAQIKTTKTNH